MTEVLQHNTLTQRYSLVQIVEPHGAQEKIKADSCRWNKTLATLRLEQQEATWGNASSQKVPQKSPRS